MKNRYQKRKSGKRRHTHRVIAGLEDALAVAIDIINEQARSLAYIEARARKLSEILKTVRANPQAYDPERPAGLRITITRR